MAGYNRFLLPAAISVSTLVAALCPAQGFLRKTKVPVTAPTTMDWAYAVSGKSAAEPPEELTPGYRSKSQRFDLYAPVQVTGARLPAILFISYSDLPMGWPLVGPTCMREGVIYIGPHKAGNKTPTAERIRIALDCFDQVRRNFPLDPDRTYIAGYSGGGNIAARIALMLPEHFGGLIASNMTLHTPMTTWHRDRMIHRLSIASIVGENEKPGLEMSKIQTPILQALGVRARCHVLPRRGHSVPPPQAFDSAFLWLEEAAIERRRHAEERPVLRIGGDVSREEFAGIALDDCKRLLEDDETVHRALKMLEEIERRWSDLPAAAEAGKLIKEYANCPEQPWVDTAKEEQLRESRFFAQVYTAAARERSGLTKPQRAMYALVAISNYEIIARDGKDQSEVNAARQQIDELRPVAENTPKLRGRNLGPRN